MNYLKVSSTPNLEQDIEAYCFFRTADDTVISDLYFPNGLPAIVFHLGNPFKYFSKKGCWEVMPRISLVSCATSPVALNSGGNTDSIAIIFRPYTLYNMLKIRIGGSGDATDIEPYIHGDLFTRLKETDCFEQRANLLNIYFAERLNGYSPEKDLFRKVCNCILENKGIVERHGIAQAYGVSENYIHKLFMQRIGISFKPYSQVIRISNILKEIYCLDRPDWMEILEKYGYYDQAHFIKDFKKIVKQTPQQYLHLDKTFSAIFSAIA